MKDTNTPLKFSLKESIFNSIKEVGEVFSCIISMIWTGIVTFIIFGIPVIVVVAFLRVVSTLF